MTQAAINYGRVLWDLSLPWETVEEAAGLLRDLPELKGALSSPVVSKGSKRRIIDRVFPEGIRSFLKVMSDRGDMDLSEDSFAAWRSLCCEKKGILEADFYYVNDPGEERVTRIKEMLCRKYGKKDIKLHMIRDPKLIGGFLIRVGDVETDLSFSGRLKRLEQKLVRR